MTADVRRRFRGLHEHELFVMPNPWDLGSARLLQGFGFQALATTSSGHAATLGRGDQRVTRGEALAHVAALTHAVDVPVSVDAERGFGDNPADVAETVALIAETGAAGCSIEDYDPSTASIDGVEGAAERVAAAAEVSRASGMVLTARAENHIYEVHELADTIFRLKAYREAGADVVFAPGLTDLDDIRRVVVEVGAPLNVLAMPNGPSVRQLASVGVRRVSTGGALLRAAYGALLTAARELVEKGTVPSTGAVARHELENAFARPNDAS